MRIQALGLVRTHGEPTRQLVARLSFLEMSPLVLERALEPFPVPVRTLDALHLASVDGYELSDLRSGWQVMTGG